MKFTKYMLMLTAGLMITGCYNKFDEVPPLVTYDSKEAFEEAFPECEYKTIEELKQIYAQKTGDTSFVSGENSDWSDTKYYQFGSIEGEPDDYYIRGKVISNDEQGNIYKSLYLLDDTGAIEVRLTSGNYLRYPMGEFDPAVSPIEIPSTWVYVRVKDLYIGNYRMMLSIGAGPTDSFNKRDEHKFYANSSIDDLTVIAEHVFVGEPTTLVEGVDIPVIDETNYGTINGQNGRKMLGRLIYFKNLTCMYAGVLDQRGQTASGIGDNIYPSWLYTENMNYANGILTKPWYKWAYTEDGGNLYGSVLFSYLPNPPSTGMAAGAYTLRTSGYSRFSDRAVVKNGAKGNLLAIYSIYSKSWTYNFGAYQLSVSRYGDIQFADEDYMSAEQVKAMTPDGSNGTYRISLDSKFIAYDVDAASVVLVPRENAEEANVVRPTFYTRYTDGNPESPFDKFVNYPSFGALTSAIVFTVNDSSYALKAVGESVSFEAVTPTDKCIDYNEAYAFTLGMVSDYNYTIAHGDKYLSIVDGKLALTSEPATWRITVPNAEYDQEINSYYVPWVGVEDDEWGGLD